MSAEEQASRSDQRLPFYIQAAQKLTRGEYDVEIPLAPPDDLGRLGRALRELARELELRYRELQQLDRITSQINAGLLLDDILDNVYRDFHQIIPYNRIGLALLEENPDEGTIVRAHWTRADRAPIRLEVGYHAPLAGSSLLRVLETGQPRILNDLTAYLRDKPSSESTRLIVEEGYRASLTCPLIASGVPVGFIFFSSIHPNAYTGVHVDVFRRIAEQLSVIVDKGRLVTELAEQKAEIERRNQELRRLSNLKNEFIGMAAHDLRTPLATIQIMTHYLRQPAPWMTEDDRDEMLQDICDQTQHMLKLLSDLLDVTQIESGKLELHLEPIPLDEFLAQVVKRQARLAAPKGTDIRLESVAPGGVCADPIRLRQVIDNLISNAVKYAPGGTTVWVCAERLPGTWKIAVRDQGPGIPPEERMRLFQEFGRLSARPTGGEHSTGLGLAIARRIVEAHGGVLDVDSPPGEGATFWFTLPA